MKTVSVNLKIFLYTKLIIYYKYFKYEKISANYSIRFKFYFNTENVNLG